MFFSGGTGTGLWSGKSSSVPPFFQSLLGTGFEVVQVVWKNGWPTSPVGVQAGEELLACRPATVIQWVHDNIYAPLGVHPGIGQCGFCITGDSGGADQVSYPLSSYGIDTIVDAAIPTSGPELAAISKGCLQVSGYAYNSGKDYLIDRSYGFSGTGPCAAEDPLFTNTWVENSVETGGVSYNYPATRVNIIVGGRDDVTHTNHARDYFQVLVQAQQPMLAWQSVPTMSHTIQDSPDGLAALFVALTGQALPSPTPTPTPVPTATPTTTPNPRSTPAAPTGLSAGAVSSSEIDLFWTDNSENETGFGVQRSTDGRTFTLVASLGANAASYQDVGLSASTKYYYRVAAINSVSHSSFSNTAMATTLSP